MASTIKYSFQRKNIESNDGKISKKLKEIMPDDIKNNEEQPMTGGEKQDDTYINTPDAGDDFDFVMAYDDDPAAGDERLLPDNSAASAINCGFIGVGGGGGKIAKAILDL